MRTKGLSLMVFILLLFAVPFSAAAQTPQISNGLAWLSSAQTQTGNWQMVETSEYYSTSAALDALFVLDPTNVPYAKGLEWLTGQIISPTDYLSRRIIARKRAGLDASAELNTLILYRNPEGGWGSDDDYLDETIDTALALQALKAVNYSDPTTVNEALAYLTGNQNIDGGWGLFAGDASNIYMTAIVSATLQQFPQTMVVATSVGKATSFLAAHQNIDGGFGSSSSTVYETALAYSALIAVSTDGTTLGNAVTYLTATQALDGSWNQDPYSTALALKALYLSENKPSPPPLPPTTGTITGLVVDSSTGQPLGGVSVFVQSDPKNSTTDGTGHFTLANIPQGAQTIVFSLSGYMQASAEIGITAGSISNLGTVGLSPSATTGIIRGTVTDASTGKPLVAATVTVSGSFSGRTVTGSDGSFNFVDVAPGVVTIVAEMATYYSVSGTGTVSAGGVLFFNPQLSTTVPTTTTGKLTGKVFDNTTAKPVQNAIITISDGQTAATDASGGFLVTDITPSTYLASVSAAGYVSQSFQVMIMAGVTTDIQTISLTPSPQLTTITGKITDASTGKAITGAQVQVVGTNLTTSTSSDGTYSISGITQFDFDVRASTIGYDSASAHITTAGYGIFAVNLSLNPISSSDLVITSLTTDKLSYASDSPIQVTAAIENKGNTLSTVQVIGQVEDESGAIVDLLPLSSPPPYMHPTLNVMVTDINPISAISAQLAGNTYQFVPGNYTFIVKILDPAKNTVVAEAVAPFQIVPTRKAEIVRIASSPQFSHLGGTETISLSLLFADVSNIPVQYSINYTVKTPAGAIINNGSVPLATTPDPVAHTVDLGSFTYTFTQSGSYPVEVSITGDGESLATGTGAISVAPVIRVEPTKTLTPNTVLPDGDKQITIKIHLQGTQE